MSEATWRLAKEDDLPAILDLLWKQGKRIGYEQDCPNFFDRPILRTEVCEMDGEIVGIAYFEANVEVVLVSTDRRFTKAVMERAPFWGGLFQSLGFRIARAFVPIRFKNAMARLLKKTWAVNLDDELSHFFFDLRR